MSGVEGTSRSGVKALMAEDAVKLVVAYRARPLVGWGRISISMGGGGILRRLARA